MIVLTARPSLLMQWTIPCYCACADFIQEDYQNKLVGAVLKNEAELSHWSGEEEKARGK